MSSVEARRVLPKYHGDEYLGNTELEEEDISDHELDVYGLFDVDDEEDERLETKRADRMERQRLERERYEKDEADAMKTFREDLYQRKKEELRKKKKKQEGKWKHNVERTKRRRLYVKVR